MALNYRKTRLNARERWLDLKLDLVGAITANLNYEKIKNRTDFDSKLRKFFPFALRQTGTASTVEFTPTSVPTWTIDGFKDMYAVFFKTLDTSTLEASASDFYKIASIQDYEIQKIVSNTATAVTVGKNIMAGATSMIIIDDIWYQIAQISDYTFSDAAATIDTNDASSGGYSSKIMGLKEADITGVTGHFMPTFHTLAQIEMAKLSGEPLEVRHGATSYPFATVWNQTVLANEFTNQGAIDGSAKLEYTGTLLNQGTPTFSTILVDGTIPDFL